MFTSRDIRGEYGKEITNRNLYTLGKVLARITPQITIGMDNRERNDKILEAILSPFNGRLRYLDRIPTPVVAYLTERIGMCITASHNPPNYNGIKFFKPKRIFYKDELQELQNQYLKILKENINNIGLRELNLEIDEDLIQHYLLVIPEIQDGIFDLCGGAACRFAKIFPKTIFDEPDPIFQYHLPEPNDNTLDQLKLETKREDKVGYAFDGDADRVVLVVKGQLIPGDILIAYTAEHYLKKNERLILSLDCSQEVFNYIRDIGRQPIYAAVGQNFVISEAIKQNATFIGEYSGHYSFNEFMYYSDPFYFIGKISDTKPNDLLAFQTQFHNAILRKKIPGKVDYTSLKQAIEKLTDQFTMVDGIKAILEEENAAILIRHSQSEPITRINIEANNLQSAKEIFQKLQEFIKTQKKV